MERIYNTAVSDEMRWDGLNGTDEMANELSK